MAHMFCNITVRHWFLMSYGWEEPIRYAILLNITWFNPDQWHRPSFSGRSGSRSSSASWCSLSAQPCTPVPRRPLPVCLQCRLQTTSSLCQPRSSRRALPSSQQLWSAGFFLWPALRYGTGYQTVWAETFSSSSVHWRRFFYF